MYNVLVSEPSQCVELDYHIWPISCYKMGNSTINGLAMFVITRGISYHIPLNHHFPMVFLWFSERPIHGLSTCQETTAGLLNHLSKSRTILSSSSKLKKNDLGGSVVVRQPPWFTWNISGISMEYLWNIYGISMEYLWNI